MADYIRNNFYWCIFWGFFLQFVGGSVTAMSHSLPLIVLGWSIYLVGTLLLLIGFGFYVRSKGRSPAWRLLALLSIIGWVILIFLKDKSFSSLNQENPEVTGYI
jgi:hypothetical protein